MDYERFAMCITALASAFGREADEATLAGYRMGLEDLSIAEIEQGVRRAVQECSFMPKPVEIRKLCGRMTQEDRTLAAWEAVTRAISSVGHWSSVDFDDPAINAAIRAMGGWPELCATDEDDMVWREKDFAKLYPSVIRRGVSRDAGAALPGTADARNIAAGYDLSRPRLVNTGLSRTKFIEAPAQGPAMLVAKIAGGMEIDDGRRSSSGGTGAPSGDGDLDPPF